jgi:ParB family transcriptional regulator, chromosome partitioning protein
MEVAYSDIALDSMLDTWSGYRLHYPERIATMEQSLRREGQLQPVVVRSYEGRHQLVDGFKRYYASQKLGWSSLKALVLTADEITAKCIIIRCNRKNVPLQDYEEALVIRSFYRDHSLHQEQIGKLLGRSASWVSRRLSFIDRLTEQVQSQLKLGSITVSHARELVNLPRGKQDEMLRLAMGHGFSTRQTALLVKCHMQGSKQEQDYLMQHPEEAINSYRERKDHDSRLGPHGNRLLKTVRLLEHQQHVMIGQSTNPALASLAVNELAILSVHFKAVLQKTKIIQSILKEYQDER